VEFSELLEELPGPSYFASTRHVHRVDNNTKNYLPEAINTENLINDTGIRFQHRRCGCAVQPLGSSLAFSYILHSAYSFGVYQFGVKNK
jgi:hypothetical protein